MKKTTWFNDIRECTLFTPGVGTEEKPMDRIGFFPALN